MASPFARSTHRQRDALEWIAFALIGEAEARLAREFGLLVSPGTLLNRSRGAFRDEDGNIRIVGVGDFGFKRTSGSATIMVASSAIR